MHLNGVNIMVLKSHQGSRLFISNIFYSTHNERLLASLPGLHAQLLSLAVRKAGKAWTDLSRDVCHS